MSLIVAVAEEQQHAGDQQGAAHKYRVGAQTLDGVLDGHDGEQRQCTDNNQQNHAAVGGHGCGRSALGQIPDAEEKFADHIGNIRPVSNKHGNQRAKVQQHVEGTVRAALQPQSQQILGNGQMAGAGDRQEFGDALNHTQDHCRENRHRQNPF